jgi:TonB family protein
MNVVNNLGIASRFIGITLLAAVLAIFTNQSNADTGYVGDEEVEITRISQGRFIYPRAALRREIEGNVELELTVGVTGEVIDAFVVEATPPNRFEKNALKLARSYKYEPYSSNGVPTEVGGIRVTVSYRIAR